MAYVIGEESVACGTVPKNVLLRPFKEGEPYVINEENRPIVGPAPRFVLSKPSLRNSGNGDWALGEDEEVEFEVTQGPNGINAAIISVTG